MSEAKRDGGSEGSSRAPGPGSGQDPGSRRVQEIMIREPATLARNDALDLADDIMRLGRIRHLPVVEDDRVVGVVSQRDLFRSALASALGYGEKAQRGLMQTLLVKEVMSTPVVTVAPECAVREAARLMVEKKIGCLPVVSGEALVGIVTETDMLKLLASV